MNPFDQQRQNPTPPQRPDHNTQRVINLNANPSLVGWSVLVSLVGILLIAVPGTSYSGYKSPKRRRE